MAEVLKNCTYFRIPQICFQSSLCWVLLGTVGRAGNKAEGLHALKVPSEREIQCKGAK